MRGGVYGFRHCCGDGRLRGSPTAPATASATRGARVGDRPGHGLRHGGPRGFTYAPAPGLSRRHGLRRRRLNYDFSHGCMRGVVYGFRHCYGDGRLRGFDHGSGRRLGHRSG